MINRLNIFLKRKNKAFTQKEIGYVDNAGNSPQIENTETPEDVPLQKEEEKPDKKWHIPNKEQLIFLIKALSEKEKRLVMGGILLACILLAAWGITMYVIDTNRAPALGGAYIEGVQGQPLHINPIIASVNPVDEDLSLLIYSSLFRYNEEGKLEQDLASNWERSDDGTVYTIKLKPEARWHDDKPLTAEDVLFTLNLIRNPAFGSVLRGNWEGTEIKKLDDNTIEFRLKKPFVPFLHNLTFGILPKHLWENITSEKFALAELNRNPIGSGMYIFKEMKKNKEGKIMAITLQANDKYYRERPKLRQITFQFYSSQEEIIEAYKKDELNGISYLESNQLQNLIEQKNLKIYEIPTTRIYAVFFNAFKSPIAADKEVRRALNLSVNKDEVIKEVLSGKGIVVNTPLLPGMLGFNQGLNHYEYDIEKAKKILDDAGWKKMSEKDLKKIKEGEGMENVLYNEKNKNFLSLTLSVPDYPDLMKAADLIKKEWEKIGMKVDLDILDTSETLQNKISGRNYEALLFGEILQPDPDPTPFWYSSNKQSPGLNLALFENQELDGILDAARQEVNEEKRAENYRRFQEIIDKEVPAVFLFSPYYLYAINSEYSGVGVKILYNPSNRLNDLPYRYLFTSRTRK